MTSSSSRSVPGPDLDAIAAGFARVVNAEIALLCRSGTRPYETFAALAPSLPDAVLQPLEPEHARILGAAGASASLTCAVMAPVRIPRECAGLLVAGFATTPADPARTLWAAEAYAGMLALAIESPEEFMLMHGTRVRDALTGCLTFESLLLELRREINRSTRAGNPLSCCFIDLDGFKAINDRFGHLKGNEQLAQVGRVLRESVRSIDVVGRYGGDEFVALLPHTSERAAVTFAQRLRATLAEATRRGLAEPISASIGVAVWSPGESPEQLLERADRALLLAKRGRLGVLSATQAHSLHRSPDSA